jgi:hypothetical protein
MKCVRAALGAALGLLLGGAALVGQDGSAPLDSAFFGGLMELEPIRRDDRLEALLGKPVSGRVVVNSVDAYPRYDRPFRITAVEEKAGSRMLFYLFTSSERHKRRLRAGNILEFRGTLMLYTPLALEKDSYILDIKLDDD